MSKPIEPNDRDAELAQQRKLNVELEASLTRAKRELETSQQTLTQVQQILRRLFASLTWRITKRINAVFATLLRMRPTTTAWDQLEQLLGRASADELPDDFLHAQYATLPHNLTTNAGGLMHSPTIHPTRVAVVGAPPLPDQLFDNNGLFALVNSLDQSDLIVTTPEQVQRLDQSNLSRSLVVCSSHDSIDDIARIADKLAGVAATNQSVADRIAARCDGVAIVVDHYSALQAIQTALASIELEENPIWFSERSYLWQQPDVHGSIKAGAIVDGESHWQSAGKDEWRSGLRVYQPDRQPVDLGIRRASEALKAKATAEIDGWSTHPKISIVMPIYRVEIQWLEAAVNSVLNQLYPHWELCLVDDCSERSAIDAYLVSLTDSRIKIKQLPGNVGISVASNEALTLATGDFIALLDHDDELSIDALLLVARVIRNHDPDLIYSDEAKLDLKEHIVEPHFKPTFSRWMIQSQNYVSHLGVYRRQLIGQIGGFRAGFEGSQDHDLLLRFAAKATTAFHIPRVLYYWRKVPQSTAARFSEKNYAWDAGVRAVQEAQATATVSKGVFPGTYQVSIPIAGTPKVSILIPFRDKPELLDQCLESVLSKTDYPHFEIIGIDNASETGETQEAIERWASRDERIRFINYPGTFNYSAINNFAAKQASGDHLLLLNNDVEVINAEWLTALLQLSQQPGVGAVGGRLLYPDNTLQHAGVVLGIGGVAGHSHKYFAQEHHGYFCRPHILQQVSAVTGACLMVKRSLYDAVGGLDENNLTVAFNDIDFCLRLIELGHENLYAPQCQLYHHESKSRGAETTLEKQSRFNAETNAMKRRHVMRLAIGDPRYNPNLTILHEDFSTA